MIQKAVEGSLYIVKTEYVLQTINSEPGQRYGRGNRSYFGQSTGLGVHVDTVLMVSPHVTTPWINDPYFEPFANSDTIRPILSTISFKPLNESNFSSLSTRKLLIMEDSLSRPETNGIIRFSEGGLALSKAPSDSTGWVILIYHEDRSELDSLKNTRVNVYRPQPKFFSSPGIAKIRPPITTENLLGGIYVIPVYSTGQIQLQAWGMVYQKDSGWYIIAFPEIPHSVSELNSSEGQEVQPQPLPLDYE